VGRQASTASIVRQVVLKALGADWPTWAVEEAEEGWWDRFES